MIRLLPSLLLVAMAACDLVPDRETVSRTARPAAAVLAPEPDADLREQLRRVDAELEAALDGEAMRVLTAEAITDQLLHAPRDIDWLATGYSLEARLRQIQAMADGIVAQMRRGATLSAMEDQIVTLRRAIADLQEQLALPGGGRAPPSLDVLLAQDPLRDARAQPRAAPAPGGPIGAPAAQVPATAQPEPQPQPAPPSPLGTPVNPDPDPDGV